MDVNNKTSSHHYGRAFLRLSSNPYSSLVELSKLRNKDTRATVTLMKHSILTSHPLSMAKMVVRTGYQVKQHQSSQFTTSKARKPLSLAMVTFVDRNETKSILLMPQAIMPITRCPGLGRLDRCRPSLLPREPCLPLLDITNNSRNTTCAVTR